MRTRITPPGTIDNTGDIQPDYLPLPDYTTLDGGLLPPPRHPASHPWLSHPAASQLSAAPSGDRHPGVVDATVADPGPADGPYVVDADQSPVITVSAAGFGSGVQAASGGTTTAAQLALKLKSSGPVTYAPLVITPEFGASITGLTGTGGDPTTAAEIEGAINAAVAWYNTNWTSGVPVGTVLNGATINTVNVSIDFDYGTLDGQAMNSSNGASQSRYGLVMIGNGSYATLYSTLSGELPNLPATDPTGGGVFYVTQAQSQILGTRPTGGNPDGWVGLNSIKNGVTLDYNLANQAITGEVGAVGAIEHEISEIFGRSSDVGLFAANTYTLFDLYRFKAAGTPALTAGSADYFSLNSGTTALGYFNNHSLGGDAGDWASSGPHQVAADAFDAFLSAGAEGTISNLDSLALGAIGLQAAPRTLQWTGAVGTSFSIAADWNDITGSLKPAQRAPGVIDTAQFLGGGGTISGTGTVAALQFGGTMQWDVAAAASLSAVSGVAVGQGGSGAVLVDGGASINGLGTLDIISGTAGTSGSSVIVDGSGSAWKSSGMLSVGAGGSGSLTISNGGSVGAAATALLPAMVLGATASGNGILTVTGAGSHATLVGQLDVGQAGSGSLTIASGGTVFTGAASVAPAQGIDIAQSAGGAGSITVSGTGTRLGNTGQFVVGDGGVGNLIVAAGGVVDTAPGNGTGLAGLLIANTTGASGSAINVDGNSSRLDIIGGALVVGSGGSGAMQISAGATVTAASLDAGAMAGSVGQIALTGGGSKLSVSGAATVADAGATVLSVLNGATFAAASLTIGAHSGSSGAVVVSGAGSALRVAGALNVGTAPGTGELTIGPDAAVHAAVVNLQGQVVLQGGLLDPTVLQINPGVTVSGFGTIEADNIINEAVIQANATPGGAPEVLRGTILGGGTLVCNGSITTNAPGVLQINSGGTMELTGAVLNAATTSFDDDLTPRGHYSLYHSEVDVRFADASGVLRLDNIAGFAGTIASIHHGNKLIIAGGTLSGLHVSNGNTLTMFDKGVGAGPDGIDQLVFASPVTSEGFDIVNGDTVQMACFAAGTLIETGHGAVPVQKLRIGDEVQTLHGGTKRIVWVGSRLVDCRRHLRPETVWPVCIERGAFGENIPLRDLFISPDHAIYTAGVLIPAKLLINRSTIRQIQLDRVVYHHIELEQHDVILAEGLAAETYLDVGDRHLFSGDPATVSYPESPAQLGEMVGCAPLVLTGETLRAVRLALAERADLLACSLVAPPLQADLSLIARQRSGAPLASVRLIGNSSATATHRCITAPMTEAPAMWC